MTVETAESTVETLTNPEDIFESGEQKRISARERKAAITEEDRAVLNIIQSDFPLAERPYAAIGEQVGQSEDEVLASLRKAKELHVLRQISAIFDSRRLGYRTSLVAMRVAPERIQEAADIINRHPGVSHNYERNHPYNLWFTVAVPPTGDLQRDVDELHALTGAEKTWLLPTLKLFKIGVVLDMSGEADLLRKSEVKHSWTKIEVFPAPSPEDQELIRVLQQDLAIEARPFDAWAAELGAMIGNHAARHDDDGTFVNEAYEVLREAGYLALAVPAELGGRGATIRQVAMAQRELARHCASTALASAPGTELENSHAFLAVAKGRMSRSMRLLSIA